MTNDAANKTFEIAEQAEGGVAGETAEPVNPLRTSVVPAVEALQEDSLSSATGVLDSIAQSEGPDADVERFDARLTPDETSPSGLPDSEQSEFAGYPPVLIVEDTVELAEVIQATLEGMGLRSVYATHGKIGLDKLRDINPRLVLMDIGLPDITGWKMLDHIKEHADAAQKPMPTVIVITAYGDPANRLIGKLQNIHSYLIKPFTPDQVEHLVRLAIKGEKPDDPLLSAGQ